MDFSGFVGLSDPIGFFICLAGFASQLWIAKRSRALFAANLIFVVVFFLTFGMVAEYWFMPFRRLLSRGLLVWLSALIQLWCLCMVAAAAILTLRDGIIRFLSGRRATAETAGATPGPLSESRRQFFRASTAAVCAAPVAVIGFGIISRKNVVVNEIDIKLPHLPRDLNNLRIVQVSDIHLGTFFSERDLARVVDAANELRGDLAVVTGDLITVKRDPLEGCLRQLARLKNTSGIWGCMGNHEHFAESEDAAAELGARLGINFLRWQAKGLKFGSNTVNLVGVDYQSPRLPYLVEVEELVEPGHFNILLSHNPDVFPVATSKGFDLVLAGHTHGGQVNVDIFDKNLNIASFFTHYTKGLYTEATSAIYVNSGIGTIGIPVRLGAPPEISLIRLCAS